MPIRSPGRDSVLIKSGGSKSVNHQSRCFAVVLWLFVPFSVSVPDHARSLPSALLLVEKSHPAPTLSSFVFREV